MNEEKTEGSLYAGDFGDGTVHLFASVESPSFRYANYIMYVGNVSNVFYNFVNFTW